MGKFSETPKGVSNQYLIDNTVPLADLGGLTRFQYLSTHWIFTDHTQIVTGSAGAVYQFCGRASTPGEMWWDSLCGTKVSADMIYGSGLRTGDANIGTEPPYAQFNTGIAHEFAMPDGKPLTVRFDIVNLFDTIYQLKSGTGIACSRRNMARVAATSSVFRRRFEAGPQTIESRECCMRR
jgi:hypothetical protein